MTDFLHGFAEGLFGIVGTAASTALGALLTFLGTIVDALAGAVAHLMTLLPVANDLGLSIPSGFVQGFSIFDQFLPLHETFAMMALLVAAMTAATVWHLAITVYHLIPKPMVGT